MDRLKALEGETIEAGIVTGCRCSAQGGACFDIRKRLADFDGVPTTSARSSTSSATTSSFTADLSAQIAARCAGGCFTDCCLMRACRVGGGAVGHRWPAECWPRNGQLDIPLRSERVERPRPSRGRRDVKGWWWHCYAAASMPRRRRSGQTNFLPFSAWCCCKHRHRGVASTHQVRSTTCARAFTCAAVQKRLAGIQA